MTIDILDITGKVVSSYTTNAYSYTLDLSVLAAGVYTMKIVGEGGIATKKISLL